MKKILVIACFFLLLACKKEKDVFNYKLEFNGPYPENRANDVALRGVSIGYHEIVREGLANYIDYRYSGSAYFDTVNPPKNNLQFNYMQSVDLPVLKPNRTYYWAFTSVIPPGEIWSNIESFTTGSFYGDWQLENVADKGGYFEMNKDNSNYWGDWTDKSYKYIKVNESYGNVIEYTPNKDSLLKEGIDITHISYFSSVKLYKGNNSYLPISFYYNESKGNASILETHSKTEHKFVAVNVGYLEYYNKVVLLMINENGIMFIYSKM